MVDFGKPIVDEEIPQEMIDNLENVPSSEVKKLKLWMFQEQVKLQAKKDELYEMGRRLQDEKESLERQKRSLQIKEQSIRKRYEDNEIFIEKKRKIIEDAYQQLAIDRKSLECERLNFEHEKGKYRKQKMAGNARASYQYDTGAYDGSCFFRGVSNELELRKRYKELLKIFHPDNQCGDTKTLLLIQTEYENLRMRYYEV